MNKRGNRTKQIFSEAVLLFLFFSIIGWLYEVTLAFIYGHGFINRGFLFGPYLPLYGTGALLLIASLHSFMKQKINLCKISKSGKSNKSSNLSNLNLTPFLTFLLIMLITTALEYAVGWFLETVFHQQFWNYSSYTWQLHGRICLSASIRFGLGGMLFLYILVPLFRKIICKIPSRNRFILAILIIILLCIDLAATLYLSSKYGFDPTLAQPR